MQWYWWLTVKPHTNPEGSPQGEYEETDDLINKDRLPQFFVLIRTTATQLVLRATSSLFTGFGMVFFMSMILPQVHLRKPCYDFSFL